MGAFQRPMAKKLKSHKSEEPPSESNGSWWFKTSFKNGKLRRIAIWCEKKRHRQSPALDVSDVKPNKRKRKLSHRLLEIQD